jgi:hypothetical protein
MSFILTKKEIVFPRLHLKLGTSDFIFWSQNNFSPSGTTKRNRVSTISFGFHPLEFCREPRILILTRPPGLLPAPYPEPLVPNIALM